MQFVILIVFPIKHLIVMEDTYTYMSPALKTGPSTHIHHSAALCVLPRATRRPGAAKDFNQDWVRIQSVADSETSTKTWTVL